MSLVCHECESVMGPSSSFPGREGTIVHPFVPAMVWLPDQIPQIGQTLAYVEAPDNLSLCFECIEKQLPAERHPLLENIYSAYSKETEYESIRQSLMGKWLRPEDDDQIDRESALWKELESIGKLPFIKACLSCGIELPKNLEPYFVARTIDKAYSQKHLTHFFGETNYSFSNLETGRTSFRFCFSCTKENFPHIHEDLSYMLRGINKRSPGKKTKNEIYLSASFLQALRDSNPKEYQKSLEKLMGDPHTDIFIQPEDNSGKPNLN